MKKIRATGGHACLLEIADPREARARDVGELGFHSRGDIEVAKAELCESRCAQHSEHSKLLGRTRGGGRVNGAAKHGQAPTVARSDVSTRVPGSARK